MNMISPTGLGIRLDKAGDGRFGAPRDGGKRSHNGTDFVCVPGQEIIAPFNGTMVRIAYPYENDSFYRGCLFLHDNMEIKLFYFVPDRWLFHVPLKQGDRMGIAQDITKKYPNQGMTPHIHLEIKSYTNPELFYDRTLSK